MENIKKYNKIFTAVFNVNETDLNGDFSITSVDNWDSITQLTLVSELEDEFDIMLDTQDILEFQSYEEGKKIVKKYNIEL
ncbi:MAG: acyl carrier protein [Flavobacteriaceae bacterium]|nr:acyl carrier protein [Flavobacteriaceae bacterium]